MDLFTPFLDMTVFSSKVHNLGGPTASSTTLARLEAW